MTPNDQLESLLSALQRRFYEGKRGSIRTAQRALGFNLSYYCSQRERKRGVSLENLLKALEYLGVDPLELLAEALEPTTDPIALIRREAEFSGGAPPPLITQVQSRLVAKPAEPRETQPPRDASFLEQLDELRYEDARLARDQAFATARQVPVELLPRLLGVYGSCLRMLEDYDGARRALALALELADARDDQPALADLWLRVANLVANLGHYPRALRLCRRATRIYTLAEEPIEEGKALLSQGIWLHYLGRLSEAIVMGKTALARFPSGAALARVRVGALQQVGRSYLLLGDLEQAMAYAREAERAAAGAPPWIRGGLLWFQAQVSIEQGSYEPAEAALREAGAIFLPISPSEAALVSIDLIRVLCLQGRDEEAYAATKALARFVEPIRKKARGAEAALVDLVCCGLKGDGLTAELLSHAAVRLAESAARPKGRAARQGSSLPALLAGGFNHRAETEACGKAGGRHRHGASSGPGSRSAAGLRSRALPGPQGTATPGPGGQLLVGLSDRGENLSRAGVPAAERIKTCLGVLKDHYRRAGHGSIRRVARALGLSDGYLRLQVVRNRLDLAFLLKALDALGIEPLDYFREALGQAPSPVLAFRRETDRVIAEAPPLLTRMHARLASEEPAKRAAPLGVRFLERLDELRYEDPRLARDQALAAVGEVRFESLPQLLGVYGSCLRMLEDYGGARQVLATALELAEARGDPPALADLWIRIANLVANFGNYPRALWLSQGAMRIYTLADDPIGVGKALLTEGIWLHYMGRLRQAIAMGEAALARLPLLPALARHRVGALQQVGRSYFQLGDLEQAIGYAREAATAAADAPAWIRGWLLWFQAQIGIEQGSHESAEAALREAAAIFAPVSPSEAILVSIDLIRTLRLQGREADVTVAAKNLARLVEPIRQKSRVAEAALIDVVRCGLERRKPDDEALERLASELEKLPAVRRQRW